MSADRDSFCGRSPRSQAPGRAAPCLRAISLGSSAFAIGALVQLEKVGWAPAMHRHDGFPFQAPFPPRPNRTHWRHQRLVRRKRDRPRRPGRPVRTRPCTRAHGRQLSGWNCRKVRPPMWGGATGLSRQRCGGLKAGSQSVCPPRVARKRKGAGGGSSIGMRAGAKIGKGRPAHAKETSPPRNSIAYRIRPLGQARAAPGALDGRFVETTDVVPPQGTSLPNPQPDSSSLAGILG